MLTDHTHRTNLSPLWVNHEEDDHEDGDSAHHRSDAEPPAPVVHHSRHLAAHNVAQPSPYWDCEVEKSQYRASLVLGEHVGDYGRRHHAVARLTDTNESSEGEKEPEVLHEGADQSGDGPEADADSQQQLAAVSVSEISKDGSEQHVADDECCLEQSKVFILGDVEIGILLDPLQHSRNCRSVHIVDEVDIDKNNDCERLSLVETRPPTCDAREDESVRLEGGV